MFPLLQDGEGPPRSRTSDCTPWLRSFSRFSIPRSQPTRFICSSIPTTIFTRPCFARCSGRSSLFWPPRCGHSLGRLWFIQGYLHSAESPGIRATLRKHGNGDSLALAGEVDPGIRERVTRVIHKLERYGSQLQAEPLETLLRMAHPGKSKHFGASFPMRRAPGPFESDILGRPHGFRRVHAVDASVLPSFPATTVTYSVMANAHRIGASWKEES